MNDDEKIIFNLKSKLITKTTGTFQVLSTADTVTIEEDVIDSTVSIESV